MILCEFWCNPDSKIMENCLFRSLEKTVLNAVIEYKESPADNSDEDEDVFLYTIENKTNKSRDEALITLEVNHSLPVKFKVDTGAQANILPAKYFDALPHPPSLNQSSQKLTSYCGSKIPVRGVSELSCKHKSSKAETLLFFIFERDSVPILGFRSSIDLNIVKIVLNVSKVEKSTCKDMHAIEKTKTDKIISSYNDVFQGIGKLDGECHLYLKDDAFPIAYPARRIPSSLRGKLEAELKRMEEQGIIEKVSKPTDWMNSMIPFGIISAQDEFQRRMEEALEGLDGFVVIIDDLLVFGSTLEEHNKRLVAVLERPRVKGIKFNKAKCSFCVTSVTYFGHVISEQGMQPDPDKFEAINNMPTPSNSEELATLLGAYISSNGNVFAYASRSLSKAEQKYSQLEKELYAIVFGCKYFHHFIYGRHVKLTTDHRPLETILRNPRQKAPARAQRMMLRIQPYDLEFSYRPGTEIPVADTLSKLYLPDIDEKLN
ncbi:hypothetical protein QYM36_003860 [Artemia franciscana]|uniref:Reverse transcriptase n=1 Tax=Artemia franciscana TaxID=6661 RepID=A0AA88L959_ARTSF|nr:hypothetical protein QYM36_003860 [Artemia franciscana]